MWHSIVGSEHAKLEKLPAITVGLSAGNTGLFWQETQVSWLTRTINNTDQSMGSSIQGKHNYHYFYFKSWSYFREIIVPDQILMETYKKRE